jgi:hypothetical protein
MASHPPDLMTDAIGPSRELSRRNTRLSLILTAIFVILFAATFAIGLLALHL